jgi:deoxyribonuclease I
LFVTVALAGPVGCADPDGGAPPTQIVIVDPGLETGYTDVWTDRDTFEGVDGSSDEDVTPVEDVYIYVEPWDCAPDLALDGRTYAHLADADGEALLSGLRVMVDDHRSLGYDTARNEMFRYIDVDEDLMLECIYSGRKVMRDGTRTPDGFNTEHVWPQSRGAREEPARSDIHHLFPIDEDVNNTRQSYEFGDVACQGRGCMWTGGGSALGPGTDGRPIVFEVRRERRGDVARAILYVALRYRFSISSGEEAVLRRWHCEDPPDERERARHAEIALRQRNRNPFVDRPDFLDRLGAFQ